jgi:hypothetical protein
MAIVTSQKDFYPVPFGRWLHLRVIARNHIRESKITV